ncbi:transcriptional regulator NrdR [Actinomadura oligospora]|uniref:transcriptional regulator NrdR n=1 Tax=Actinomadura oligospora TaxID=111804 RepID=UPI0004B06B4C|nr:transcriptional regulator NrdR [Actinomadura oligospora]
MHCPFCRNPDTKVIDSRSTDDGAAIRRRRSCPECGKRFTTQENVLLMVAKRSGVTEPFSRDKIVAGVRRACQGRPVDEDALAKLGQRVEEALRATGSAEVPSHEVGLAILGPLGELDEVAYLRFASVYRGFESLDDFAREIEVLRRVAGGTETGEAGPGEPGGPDGPGGAAGGRSPGGGAAADASAPQDVGVRPPTGADASS